MLPALGRALGGGHDRDRAWGEVAEVATTVGFRTRTGSCEGVMWTEIDVELPKAYPLTLNVRRYRAFDRAQIERGALLDLSLGDPLFDEAFLVEAAPAEVVRELLDGPTRAALSALRDVELSTETTVAGKPMLRMAMRGWQDDEGACLAWVDVAVSFARRVREAYAKAEDASTTLQGGPFRLEVDGEAIEAAKRAREADVARLREVQTRREGGGKELIVVMSVLLAMLVLVFVALAI